jgi:hypothetical protein
LDVRPAGQALDGRLLDGGNDVDGLHVGPGRLGAA